MPDRLTLLAECDRICGVNSAYHKDRCPLYKANCEAMWRWRASNNARSTAVARG